jgi:hypothetical protein
MRQEEICKCFGISLNAIEELFEISVFMNKLMHDQNPATDYDLKKYYPQHYQKTLKARREGIYNYVLVNLKKGIKEGLYRKELNVEIIAKLYLWRSEDLHINNIWTNEEFASVKLFLELLNYHIRGIATERGIVELERKIKELESAYNK